MRKSLVILIAVAATALLVPLAAEARGEPAGGPVSVQLELPVGFTPPTTLCPEGRAHFGISSGGQAGSGINCLASVTPVACPDFCQEAVAFMKLTLPAGRINGPVTLHETFTCNDPFCLTADRRAGVGGNGVARDGCLPGAPRRSRRRRRYRRSRRS